MNLRRSTSSHWCRTLVSVGGDAKLRRWRRLLGPYVWYRFLQRIGIIAQFGSDLDEATQAKLARGQRTMEVLKQGLHEPQTVSQQVVTLFALSHGFIDKIPLDDVQRYESELAAYMHANHQDLYDSIQKL